MGIAEVKAFSFRPRIRGPSKSDTTAPIDYYTILGYMLWDAHPESGHPSRVVPAFATDECRCAWSVSARLELLV